MGFPKTGIANLKMRSRISKCDHESQSAIANLKVGWQMNKQ
ncbi:hypothetical protein [Moorena sp. SIOASIH]|nr:hypothetical protein [Moorena sp. SIOASIH]